MIIQANQVLVNGEPMSLMQAIYQANEDRAEVYEGMIECNSLAAELLQEPITYKIGTVFTVTVPFGALVGEERE
jgi:hypothetical protein